MCRTLNICEVADICEQLKRSLRFDLRKGEFVGDPASAFASRSVSQRPNVTLSLTDTFFE